jgi:hypothetical protein
LLLGKRQELRRKLAHRLAVEFPHRTVLSREGSTCEAWGELSILLYSM